MSITTHHPTSWLALSPPERGQPLLRFEARTLPQNAHIQRDSRRLLLGLPLIGTALWLPLGAVVVIAPDAGLHAMISRLLLLLIALGIMDRLGSDFLVVTSALNTSRSDRVGGRWDAICVTGISAWRFYDARHQAAVLRVWRVLAAIRGLRLALVVLFLLHFVALPLLFPAAAPGARALLLENPLHLPGILAAVFVTWGVLSAEAYQRVWMLTALSVGLSTRLDQNVSLRAVGVLLEAWLVRFWVYAMLAAPAWAILHMSAGPGAGWVAGALGFAVAGPITGSVFDWAEEWRFYGVRGLMELGLSA